MTYQNLETNMLILKSANFLNIQKQVPSFKPNHGL